MTNKKTTKRALFMSAMAMLLCFTMLLGTTYAWFTDSATSGSNVIKSGNLDIVVEYTLGDEDANGDLIWKELDGATDLFQKGLWEPGHTEVVLLKITNNGSLALKYAANMNIVNETVGKTKDNKDIVLSEILTVSTCTQQYTDGNGNVASGADIFPAMTFNADGGVDGWIGYQTSDSFKNSNVLKNDKQLQPKESDYIAVKVDMPETVGNEANHDGKHVPSIEFGLNVLATQYTYENDSFGNQYDADAEYPVVYDHVVSDLAGLKTAFADGGSIQLTANIDVPATLRVEPDVAVNLDLNGKTITVPNGSTSSAFNSLFYAENGSDITISGNGTVNLGENGMSLVVTRGNVTIENGTFIRKVTDPSNAYPLISDSKYADGNGTTVINGGYFDGGYYDENAADIEELLAGTKTLKETADDIAKRGNSGDKNLVRVAIKDNITGTLNLSKSTFKVYGGTFVGANPAWGDEGAMLPTTPNYLRPWSYYQGALLDGQTFNANGIVLPEGYTITKGTTADGIPTYTVEYSK